MVLVYTRREAASRERDMTRSNRCNDELKRRSCRHNSPSPQSRNEGLAAIVHEQLQGVRPADGKTSSDACIAKPKCNLYYGMQGDLFYMDTRPSLSANTTVLRTHVVVIGLEIFMTPGTPNATVVADVSQWRLASSCRFYHPEVFGGE
jgi:hypothetical protein